MLTLIMALMPVAVSYAHYSDFTGQLAAMQVAEASDHADHTRHSDEQAADHCQAHASHHDKLHSADCSFHVCVGCAVTSSFQFTTIHSHAIYMLSEKLEPLSLVGPPDIRPPISPL